MTYAGDDTRYINIFKQKFSRRGKHKSTNMLCGKHFFRV